MKTAVAAPEVDPYAYLRELLWAYLRLELMLVRMRQHSFQAIDPYQPCPVCSFPSWAHDPSTAVLFRRPFDE